MAPEEEGGGRADAGEAAGGGEGEDLLRRGISALWSAMYRAGLTVVFFLA